MIFWYLAVNKLRQRIAIELAKLCSQFSCLRVPNSPEFIEYANYKFYSFVQPDNLKAGWSSGAYLVAEINA